MLKALLLLLLLLSSSLLGGEAQAQKRIALVIGNSNYVNVRPIPNPENDASAIAALFKTAGFDVVDAHNNLGGIEMRRAFRDFAEKSRNADIAVVFYAGHGIEVDGENYLLPVDTSLKRDIDVEDEAVSLDRVVRTLEPAKRLRLIILDACRDNPFVRTVRRTSETRSIGRGLAKVEPPSSNTLIAFAAKAGSTAADGDDRHSPFTTALLRNLTTPGLDLRIALGRVRDEVIEITGKRQEPFVYGSLGGTTVSLLPEPKQVMAAPPPAPPVSAPLPDLNADARSDYDRTAQVGTLEAWDAFLALHSTGFFADLARGQRAKLLAAVEKVAARTSPSAPSPSAQSPPAQSSPAVMSGSSPPASAPQVTVLSSMTPATAPEVPKPGPDTSETARLMHAELQRLGCYLGAVDASWGSGSRLALERFNKRTGQKLDTQVASLDTLGVLRGKTTRVCPLQCKTGYRADDDACVKIACRAGYVLGEKGECERQQKSKAASRPEPREPRESRQAAPRKPGREASPTKVVCGMNGCLDVKPGCRSELRASGRGEVAVVLCGNR
jgi:hypothetical protein